MVTLKRKSTLFLLLENEQVSEEVKFDMFIFLSCLFKFVEKLHIYSSRMDVI